MQEWYRILPYINAGLNASSAIFILIGYRMIRRKRVTLHRFMMLTALVLSIFFLLSYLVYHAKVGTTRFSHEGLVRMVYLLILMSHSFLAMVLVPLVGVTLYFAFSGQFDRHRRIARWTFPIWLYVSVTGVLVFYFLYLF